MLSLAILPITCMTGTAAQTAADARHNHDGASAGSLSPGGVLSLQVVVEEVLHHNRSLKAAQANWEAMKQRIPQARAWEDLRAGVDVERFGTTRFDTFTDNEWMISQEIPISGKNRLRGRAATAEAAGAFVELHRREIDLAVRARAAYSRLANAFAQLDLNQKNVDLWKQFIASARNKYELGLQSQADVLVAETEAGRLEESRFDVERQISEAQSDLNVLMNRPPKSPLGRPGALSPPELPGALPDLQQMALAHRPDLIILQKKIEAAKTRVTLAKREWIPDPEIRVEARQYNGSAKAFEEYDTGIFFKVPWVNRSKYKAAIEEARSIVESTEHDLESMQAETLGMVRNQLQKLETLHHHYELFRTKLAPLAWQTVESKRLSYESDKSTLLDLLTAQRTARETESAMQQHLSDYFTAHAELEGMIGARFGMSDARSALEKK
jgi:outer membrane protein TolC